MRFFLLVEKARPDGQIVLEASADAVNVFRGGLNLRVEDAQMAMELVLQAQLERGDLDEAVRLRFRAGLARLEAAGVIASRLVTTTDQVRRTVHNRTFDDLATQHEAIAYAGQRASSAEAGAARVGWPLVIEEVAPQRTTKP